MYNVHLTHSLLCFEFVELTLLYYAIHPLIVHPGRNDAPVVITAISIGIPFSVKHCGVWPGERRRINRKGRICLVCSAVQIVRDMHRAGISV